MYIQFRLCIMFAKFHLLHALSKYKFIMLNMWDILHYITLIPFFQINPLMGVGGIYLSFFLVRLMIKLEVWALTGIRAFSTDLVINFCISCVKPLFYKTYDI